MKLCNELIGLSNECKVRYIEKVQSIFKYNSTSSQDPYLIYRKILLSVRKQFQRSSKPCISRYLSLLGTIYKQRTENIQEH